MSSWLQTLRWRLHHLDVALSYRIALPPAREGRSAWQVGIAWVGAHLGDTWLWAIVLVFLLRDARRRRDQDRGRQLQLVIGWLISLIGAIVLTLEVKHVVRRQRPGHGSLLYGIGADVHSFPSGHAARMGATLVWAPALWPALAWLTGPLALCICWSRVRLGIHYVSDMAGGIALGAAVGLVVRRLVGLVTEPVQTDG